MQANSLPKILMVDDEKAILKLVELKFRKQIKEGALSFLFTDSPESALKLIKSDSDKKIKIIISDINMGKISGFDLCKSINQVRDDLVLYICSAYDRKDYRDKANQLGVKRYFPKPLNFGELEACIQNDLKENH